MQVMTYILYQLFFTNVRYSQVYHVIIMNKVFYNFVSHDCWLGLSMVPEGILLNKFVD